MPLIETKGAGSAQGFGEFAKSGGPAYIEDVFSTWLYAGSASAQTITNGINLSGKGGMVWIKDRTLIKDHVLEDTSRGAGKLLFSNLNSAQGTADGITLFNSNGFDLNAAGVRVNESGSNYVSWTFREQPKFFDVVTYTGTGSAQNIAHALGAVPGCIIVKRTDSGANWQVYHKDLTSAASSTLVLNNANGQGTDTTAWNSTAPTASVFTVGTSLATNASAGTYVAYLFASDAGGFGLTGTDNVITCGSFTTNGSGLATVSLGYEPQWLLFKQTSGGDNWRLFDNMRGWSMTSNNFLFPNTTAAETASSNWGNPTSTGFTIGSANFSVTYIYIAIRRGPMKTPTAGTSVFLPSVSSTSGVTFTTGFNVDMFISTIRAGWARQALVVDRLRGSLTSSETSNASAESTAISTASFAINNAYLNSGTSAPLVSLAFGRAPGFFDEVCYTGTGANRTVSHNLGVVPEIMIVKARVATTNTADWDVYSAPSGPTKVQFLNTTDNAVTQSTHWNDTAPTSTVFTVGTNTRVNESAKTYVAYLFATCPGVSKVGSYTGTGASQVINCGFTSGARFVLIKRTDTTGDWYVYNTAQGMVSGSDYYFFLNDITGETNANYVFTSSTGFTIQSGAPAGINASGGTYIFLAIA